jgi:hypothetical protein
MHMAGGPVVHGGGVIITGHAKEPNTSTHERIGAPFSMQPETPVERSEARFPSTFRRQPYLRRTERLLRWIENSIDQ